jgi:hypothetical protein
MAANIAVSFLQSILPGTNDLQAAVGLTNDVSIDIADAKVSRMKVPTIEQFLGREESKPFCKFVIEQKAVPYLVYEIWRAKKLKITAVAGRAVSTKIDVGASKVIFSDAKLGFSYHRTTTNELEIEGDRYFVFAVRTGKLEHSDQSDPLSLTLVNTHFLYPSEWGIKGGEEYSSPISPVTLMSSLSSVR